MAVVKLLSKGSCILNFLTNLEKLCPSSLKIVYILGSSLTYLLIRLTGWRSLTSSWTTVSSYIPNKIYLYKRNTNIQLFKSFKKSLIIKFINQAKKFQLKNLSDKPDLSLLPKLYLIWYLSEMIVDYNHILIESHEIRSHRQG